MAARDKTEQTRQQIVEATDNLLYHKGFNLMSFSDIAEVSKVPRGNLYYYFKTKDEVLAAVVDHRIQQMRTMLDIWDVEFTNPRDRLKRFIDISSVEAENIVRYGCPIGSLTAELGKQQIELKSTVKRQMDVFKRWIKKQFQLLAPDQDVDALTLHLLVRTQGMSTVSSIYKDKKLLKQEAEQLKRWIDRVT